MGHIILDCRTRERNEAREGNQQRYPSRSGNNDSRPSSYQPRSGYYNLPDHYAYGAFAADDSANWRMGNSCDQWRPGTLHGTAPGEANSGRGSGPTRNGPEGEASASGGGVTIAAVEQIVNSDRPSVRLNSTNYALWDFQFRVFVEGRGLLSIPDGTQPKPEGAAACAQAIAAWNQNDARVRSCLLGRVDPSTCLSLRLYPTSNRMWRHLAVMYSTVNAARQFEIQLSLTRLEQGDRTVSEYFNDAQELWTKQVLLNVALRPQAVLTEDAIAEKMQTRLLNFLMKLRPKFESVRATLLNRDILQFDGVLGTLVREETRLRTQASIDVRPDEGEVLAVAAEQGNPGLGHNASVYAVAKPQFQRRVYATYLECHHCRERGHVQKHCRRRNFCVVCKRMGHIMFDCRTKERNEAREGNQQRYPSRSENNDSRPSSYQPRSGYYNRPNHSAYGAFAADDSANWRMGNSRNQWRPGTLHGTAPGEANSGRGSGPARMDLKVRPALAAAV
ncbi:unnamed protein product [Linum trigynum]|uniref:CCHC-type domain-containing protein n=1 Tax=Linum trigynum TaxID=586398 RepID=A0AAV2DSB3_9ROSI